MKSSNNYIEPGGELEILTDMSKTTLEIVSELDIFGPTSDVCVELPDNILHSVYIDYTKSLIVTQVVIHCRHRRDLFDGVHGKCVSIKNIPDVN